MDNIIEFKPKEVVYILNFVSPHPIRMSKSGNERIRLTLNRKDFTTGIGQAWVPAANRRLAKQKLKDMIDILEWID